MRAGPNAGRGRRVEAPEPPREFNEHEMTPIPVPPFRDDADEKAALAAAVAVVASLVLGEWPHPDRLAAAVAALGEAGETS